MEIKAEYYYMILGGMPYYITLLNPGDDSLTVSANNLRFTA